MNQNQNNINQNIKRNRNNTSNINDNIGLSPQYNLGIYSKKTYPKQNVKKELFTYFKYLTVLRAYQLNSSVIEQSVDPFVVECRKITAGNRGMPYRSDVIASSGLKQVPKVKRDKYPLGVMKGGIRKKPTLRTGRRVPSIVAF